MRLLSPPFYSGFPGRQRIKGPSLNRLLGNIWSGGDLKDLEHPAPPCLSDSRVTLETRISKWRRGRDSNPRYGVAVYTLSRRAPSTARTPLQIKMRFFPHAFGPPAAVREKPKSNGRPDAASVAGCRAACRCSENSKRAGPGCFLAMSDNLATTPGRQHPSVRLINSSSSQAPRYAPSSHGIRTPAPRRHP